jgi:lantibiotic transport system permease protein
MTNSFFNSFQSEWLKKKRSLVSWMVLVGALFTPLIILASRLKNIDKLPDLNRMDDFWIKLWNQSWESMAVFFLPMGVILATALITQIEYKNNAWKQLHTTPQRFGTIYFAKLTVILIMMAGLFVLFNIGMYLSGVLPSLFSGSVPFPDAPIPFEYFLRQNLNFFIDTLPILALQYLISLHYKNFLVPVGVGFLIWTLSIGMASWHYSYIFPYIYSALDHFIKSGNMTGRGVNLQLIAFIYFVVFTIAGYILYVTKSEKG